MKGAQVGGTEAIQNAIGYFVDQSPGPMMIVQPTVDLAKRYSRQRLEPLFTDTPCLRRKVASQKSRNSTNTVLSKEFEGGVLIITGANSAVGLRSMPARYLLLDEIDGYPVSIDDEGDPIDLAEARQRTYARRKRLKVSTPTNKATSRILSAFMAGDQRYYHVPCPHCGHMQKLAFAQLKWKQYGLAARDAVYECISCEEVIENHHKTQMLERGRWVPENPDADPRRRSYHLSSLYSPVGWFSWGEVAEMWERAQGDTEKLRVFVNTVLGECWEDRGDAPDWQRLFDRRESYAIGTAPAGVVMITAGVDVQKDRLVYEVIGWGKGKQSWSIDAGVLPGDTAEKGVWSDLDKILDRSFMHESGIDMRIASLAVDSGYNTQHVYSWARLHTMPRVIAVKGVSTSSILIGAPSKVDLTISGRRMERGYKIWPVGINLAKSEFYGFLRLERPTSGDAADFPAGYCHFPQYGEDIFKQFTAEQLVTRRKRNGFVQFEWELIPGRENHWLDCRVYARAAAALAGLDRMSDLDFDRVHAPRNVKPDPEPFRVGAEVQQRTGKRRKNADWLKRRR